MMLYQKAPLNVCEYNDYIHTHFSTILFIFSIYHFQKEMKEKRLMGMNCQRGIKGKWVHIPLFDLSSFQT